MIRFVLVLRRRDALVAMVAAPCEDERALPVEEDRRLELNTHARPAIEPRCADCCVEQMILVSSRKCGVRNVLTFMMGDVLREDTR